jgi:DNA-3-methyladenine glycosylase
MWCSTLEWRPDTHKIAELRGNDTVSSLIPKPAMKITSQFGNVMPPAFFNRDPRRVARELLGKVLVRRQGRKLLAARIVEVEAYLGEGDPAAHAAAGRTARNAVLFGPPGYAYIYFIYGNHYCLNVSCLPDGVAGGILFRALEPLAGIAEMARARGISIHGQRDLRNLTSGPGRLAQAFGITRQRDNGKDLTSLRSDLWLADDGHPRPGAQVTKRIGITKATEQPLRYLIAGNTFVSGPKRWS